MARIRSIKPEFWTDGCNLRLSEPCALFFIGLWNFCDDEGKHRLDLNQLVAELGGRWHQGKIKLFVSCLIKSGQLRINSDSTWIQVTGWSHQKIDKPRQPDVKAEEIQWVEHKDSTTFLEQSRMFGARIGSDRIIEDRIGSLQKNSDSSNLISIDSEKRKRKAEPSAGVQVLISHYCDLWFLKYKAKAPISGKSAGCFKTLMKDYGLEKAMLFVDAFMQMNDSWFVTKRHDVSSLLANINAVAQFAETGRMFTRREINELDRSSTNQETLRALEAGEI